MADTPKIRFKGFTDAWEQRKLGEIADIKTGPFGSTLHADDYVDDGIPIITTEHFKSGQLPTVKDDIPQVSDDDYLRLSSYTLKTDDIVFSRVGSVDINALVTPFQDKWLFSGRVLRVRPNAEVGSMFLHTLLETDDIRKDIASRAVGQTMPSINTEILKITLLCLPQDIEEQHKIGVYFQALDHLITLHQHKCDETKELKKYMLQKMFPRNGEKNPEIRFAGFTGDWEQRKLSEIADKVTEKNKKNEFSEPFTNSAELGIISQRDYFDREVVNQENLDGYYIVRNDDFVYNPRISVTAPVGPINRNRLGRNGVMSPLYTVFRTHGINNLYLEFYFKTTSWHRFMKLNGDSGARFDRFTISSTQFMDMPIPFPNRDEQRKIGENFDNLDRLITLHQRKCDELKEVKKFTLQNMFPQKG